MALLPDESSLIGSSTTNAQQRTNFSNWRQFCADLLGTNSSNKAAARTALGAQGAVVGVQAFSATPTFDFASNSTLRVGTLTGNGTSATIPNPTEGPTCMVTVQQDGTGGRTFAVPTGVKIAGSVGTLANQRSVLTLINANGTVLGAWTVFAP